MNVRHEYHGTAPISLKAGHTYAVTLADVTTIGTGDGESGVVIFHWDVSTAQEVPPEEPPQLHLPDAMAAFRDLKEAGPGAMCEECGHFAGRHVNQGSDCDERLCHFPYEPARACDCKGFVWQGFRFAMQLGSGPTHITEKA